MQNKKCAWTLVEALFGGHGLSVDSKKKKKKWPNIDKKKKIKLIFAVCCPCRRQAAHVSTFYDERFFSPKKWSVNILQMYRGGGEIRGLRSKAPAG